MKNPTNLSLAIVTIVLLSACAKHESDIATPAPSNNDPVIGLRPATLVMAGTNGSATTIQYQDNSVAGGEPGDGSHPVTTGYQDNSVSGGEPGDGSHPVTIGYQNNSVAGDDPVAPSVAVVVQLQAYQLGIANDNWSLAIQVVSLNGSPTTIGFVTNVPPVSDGATLLIHNPAIAQLVAAGQATISVVAISEHDGYTPLQGITAVSNDRGTVILREMPRPNRAATGLPVQFHPGWLAHHASALPQNRYFPPLRW